MEQLLDYGETVWVKPTNKVEDLALKNARELSAKFVK